ncbi:MAG: hypothetical protein HGA51_08575 [Demequinaceae bacterium]|nr:hypothetical protein [Demequinaceae bacterium]
MLTHSILGLDSNVESWADWLRVEGHQVLTVDLFGGDTFTNFNDGIDRAESGKMMDYAAAVREAARNAEAPVVLMGFSIGAVASEIAAMTEPGIAGLILVGGASGPQWFGDPAWPQGLRAQLHYAEDDTWMEGEEAADLVAAAPEGALEVFTYPGSAHLFAFPNFSDYDALAADSLRKETKAFLASFD